VGTVVRFIELDATNQWLLHDGGWSKLHCFREITTLPPAMALHPPGMEVKAYFTKSTTPEAAVIIGHNCDGTVHLRFHKGSEED
jgi:hypothetical protein